MAGFYCHGRWVRECGDPRNFDVLILADSQFRPKCERPRDFGPVPGTLIWSISGGKMKDFQKLLKQEKSVASKARLIIAAGIGSNDLTRLGKSRRVAGKVRKITGYRGNRKYHLSGPLTTTKIAATTTRPSLGAIANFIVRKPTAKRSSRSHPSLAATTDTRTKKFRCSSQQFAH